MLEFHFEDLLEEAFPKCQIPLLKEHVPCYLTCWSKYKSIAHSWGKYIYSFRNTGFQNNLFNGLSTYLMNVTADVEQIVYVRLPKDANVLHAEIMIEGMAIGL